MKRLMFAALAIAALTVASCEEEEYGYAPVYASIECLTPNPQVGDTCILELKVEKQGNCYYRSELTWKGSGGVFLMPDMPRDLCQEILISDVPTPSAKIKYVDPETYVPTVKWVPKRAGTYTFSVSGTVSLSLAAENGVMGESVPAPGSHAIKGSVTVKAAD